jgi:hypothetical protein
MGPHEPSLLARLGPAHWGLAWPGLGLQAGPCTTLGPGGHLEWQEESRGVEVSRDRQKDVNGAEYDGNRPRSEENERVVETNTLHRVAGPGGHLGEQV